MIDWTSILTALAGLIGGGGLSAFAYRKANKKKAEAEADSAAVASMKQTLDAMTDTLNEVRKSNDKFIEIHEDDAKALSEKDKAIAANEAEISDLRAMNATVSMLVCRHVGCSLREPIYGSGVKWYEKYKDDISLGIDHTPVNVLLRMQGKKKKEIETGTADSDNIADE